MIYLGLTSIIITLLFSLIAQMVLHFLQKIFNNNKKYNQRINLTSVELSIFLCSKFISFLKEKRKKQSQLKRLEFRETREAQDMHDMKAERNRIN